MYSSKPFQNWLATTCLLFTLTANAQREYFVTINPSTGAFTKLDSLPGVAWIQTGPVTRVIDRVNNRYYFKGQDAAGTHKLFAVNCLTGKLIKAVPFTAAISSYTVDGHYQFDDSTGNIYSTATHLPSGNVHLLKLDTATAAYSLVAVLPQVSSNLASSFASSTFDQTKHRYILSVVQGGFSKILVISPYTGAIISSAAFTGNYNPPIIRFNNSNQKLFGIYEPSFGTVAISEFDISTALPTNTIVSAAIMGAPSVKKNPNYITLNEINNDFTFATSTELRSYNLTTGSLVANATFPVGLTNPNENVIELCYNSNNGILYGLHWSYTEIKLGVSEVESQATYFSPNPSNGLIIISGTKPFDFVELSVSTHLGQTIITKHFEGQGPFTLSTSELPPGLYYLELTPSNGKTESKKLLIAK